MNGDGKRGKRFDNNRGRKTANDNKSRTNAAIGNGRAGAAQRTNPPSSGAVNDWRKLRTAPAGARELALEALLRVEAEGAYSGLALNALLVASKLSRPDAALATELVYGTIQRLNTIDVVLAARVKGWPRKIAPWVRQLLRISYYQLRWLDRIPAHAAVDEAVRIAKKRGHSGIAGLVNGVLRGLLREGLASELPSGLPPVERIALTHSYPTWLVERWINAYGADEAARICEAGNEPPHAAMRVNRLRTSRDAMLAALAEAGFAARPSRLCPDVIVAERAGNLAESSWYREGLISVQDESAALVSIVAAPQPGMTVLDCCAAPGGKSAHMAELMENRGRIVAADIHPHKRLLIEQQKTRLGLDIIETVTADARELDKLYPTQSMDVVVLDAPCSGLGVIRRKPEIKWNKQPEDIRLLAALQQQLLQTVSRLVKPGGVLVYSTCTIAREENEDAVDRFLADHPAFMPDADWPAEALGPLRDKQIVTEPFAGRVQLLPHHFNSDGFFIARMRRKPDR